MSTMSLFESRLSHSHHSQTHSEVVQQKCKADSSISRAVDLGHTASQLAYAQLLYNDVGVQQSDAEAANSSPRRCESLWSIPVHSPASTTDSALIISLLFGNRSIHFTLVTEKTICQRNAQHLAGFDSQVNSSPYCSLNHIMSRSLRSVRCRGGSRTSTAREYT
jgi:hypothetical protein